VTAHALPSLAERRRSLVAPLADIVVFGKLLCPNMNNAWNEKEVGYHTGSNDYWVSVRGVVYDLTKFYKIQ
jgi:cytochrome b involved in lipid metabolism